MLGVMKQDGAQLSQGQRIATQLRHTFEKVVCVPVTQLWQSAGGLSCEAFQDNIVHWTVILSVSRYYLCSHLLFAHAAQGQLYSLA